ncbi:MAG: hypothetical protein IJ746_01525 [Ruminococcus sp.]|nr:hypothetical protein [Ruminococcus sp.]
MDTFLIFRQMLSSDSGWFLVIGFGLSFIIGLLIERRPLRIFSVCASAAFCIICEVILDFRLAGSIGGGIMSLIFGTVALGAALGFGAAALIKRRNAKEGR